MFMASDSDALPISAQLFGYRNDFGQITHKFGNAKEALLFWQNKDHRGSPCRLMNGRWCRIKEATIWKETQKKIALHMLRRLIRIGYTEDGTDEVVEGSQIFGGYWWSLVRDAVLERDGKCQLCGHERFSDLQVHHILPRHCGGSDHPMNLITVCVPCHKMIHRNKQNENISYHKSQTRLEVEM